MADRHYDTLKQVNLTLLQTSPPHPLSGGLASTQTEAHEDSVFLRPEPL